MKKKTKLIVASLGIIGMNLGTVLTATVAWFSANERVTGSGVEIIASTNETVQVMDKSIYMKDYDTDTYIQTDNLDLAPYDCFIQARNTDARKFVRLSLRYPNGIPENTNLLLRLECTGNLWKTIEGSQYVAENISNLVQFKIFDNKNGEIDDTSVQTIYDGSKAVFENINASATFVNLSGDGNSQTASKPATYIESSSISLDSTSDPDFRTDLFIEYTYNTDLLNFYQNHANVDFDLNVFTGSTEIEFAPDVTKLVIDTTTSA